MGAGEGVNRMANEIKPITKQAPADLDVADKVRQVEEAPSGSMRVKEAVGDALVDDRVTHAEVDRVEAAGRADVKSLWTGKWSGDIDAHDVAQMRSMLEAPDLDSGVRARIQKHIDAHEAALGAGEIVGKANVEKRGDETVVREHFFTQLDLPLDQVLARYDPTVWSLNLPFWRGGEVRETGRHVDERGRTIVEHTERMSLDGGDGLADKLGLTNLDMTKKLRVIDDRDNGLVRIEWSVYHSDGDSVQKDEGFIELKRTGDKTLVTTKSDHVVNPMGAALVRWALPEGQDNWLPNEMARNLGNYFTETLGRIRDIATGERQPVTRAQAIERGLLVVD